MSDWQAGDLALCVRPVRELVRGRVYTVTEVWIGGTATGHLLHDWKGIGLRFGFEGETICWNSCRFIKVTPPEADEFDCETIELENRKPVKDGQDA